MKTLESLVAEKLLKIKAVKLQPANPFTWASGWKSPIYNDNRKTLSYPVVRSFIKLELARVISEKFENVDAIAGVATGAIANHTTIAIFPYYLLVILILMGYMHEALQKKTKAAQ